MDAVGGLAQAEGGVKILGLESRNGRNYLPQALRDAKAQHDARFLYLLPNFQNPSGRCMGAARRLALADRALEIGLPIVEDNPYGELWFDAAPPPPLSAHAPGNSIYLGSFSKVLAPGLRLGYVVAPKAIFPKLLQAKQAADLHTPGFNQRVVHEVIRDGFLREHVPTVRARYKAQRDAMRAALEQHLPSGCRWKTPAGGMFFWVELPEGVDATASVYSVEHVPWVMYFHDSFALHGAFWHQGFGRTHSHGCVNLAPADARLLVSKDLHLQPSALTGESTPVEKEAAAGDESDATMVWLGTSVVSGTFLVVAVGVAPAAAGARAASSRPAGRGPPASQRVRPPAVPRRSRSRPAPPESPSGGGSAPPGRRPLVRRGWRASDVSA